MIRGLALYQPAVRSVSMILHGPGYGLDVDDAFMQLLQGLMEGFAEVGDRLPQLERIYVTERSATRASRLTALAASLWRPAEGVQAEKPSAAIARSEGPAARTAAPVPSSRMVFVAMSFADDFMDTFEIGIYEPIKSLDITCERSDSTAFVGDIVQHIRERIEAAALIVAEVTSPNPNVYLEIGYAWGRNKPVLLVCRDSAEVSFDVRNHNCIKYKSLVELRKKIAEHVRQLVGDPRP